MTVPDLVLRAAVPSDASFAYLVEEEAMRAYAEQTWGRWSPAADRDGFLAAFVPAAHQVIVAGGEDAGILSVDPRPDQVFVAKLYLRPAHRGQGIGGRVLGDILRDATRRGLPVQLRALAVNTRAQAFYARHGFRVASSDAERVYLVHRASG